MILKDIIFKIKEDLKCLFFYPTIKAGEGFEVDYDIYWEKRRGKLVGATLSRWQKKRAECVAQIVKAGETVLDLGCGDGATLEYLRENCSIVPIGVDISLSSISALEQRNIRSIHTDIEDKENLKLLPEVDYIIGFEILEHMANPEAFIYSVKGKCRKSLIFSFPNTGYYAHRLRFLLGRFPLQWIAHPGEHLRFWTCKDVLWWVNMIGFKMEKLTLYEGIPVLNKIFPKIFSQGIIIQISENGK